MSNGSSAFWENLNLTHIVSETVTNLEAASSTVGASFEKVGLEQIARVGRLGWQTLKTSLPLTLTGIVATYGTSYGLKYLYAKLEDSITKPKLATEVRYYNLASRVTQSAKTTIRYALDTSINTAITAQFFKSALAIGIPISMRATQWLAPTMTPFIPSWFTSFATCLDNEVLQVIQSENIHPIFFFGAANAFAQKPLEFDYLDFGSHTNWNKVTKTLPLKNLQILDRLSIGIGALVTAKCIYSAYQIYKKNADQEPKAIFNEQIQEVIEDVTQATYNIQKNNGFFENMLLYGPGGTGKTMVAKLIARNSKMNYVMMSGGDLAQYIKRKEHVTELNKLIERAKNSSYPTILFIDEAESLARDRNSPQQSPEHVELLNAFLNHTGEASQKLMIIMATNRLEDIDEAVLSRMDHKIHIAPPAAKERQKILEQYIQKFFNNQEVQEFFTSEKIEEISEKVEGFTGRAIFKMLNSISNKKLATKDRKLTVEIIDKVVNRFIEQEQKVIDQKAKKEPAPAATQSIEIQTDTTLERVDNAAVSAEQPKKVETEQQALDNKTKQGSLSWIEKSFPSLASLLKRWFPIWSANWFSAI